MGVDSPSLARTPGLQPQKFVEVCPVSYLEQGENSNQASLVPPCLSP